MEWVTEILDRLAEQTAWGYRAPGSPATEPTAYAALALISHGRASDAAPGLQWLADLQGESGSLGVSAAQDSPWWPTALGILAWEAHDRALGADKPGSFRVAIDKATHWSRVHKGKPTPPSDQMGHNTLLIGWPWVEGTHSWIEPTALNVAALKATGFGDHERTREAVRLLVDRLLPGGGCNYGNTVVLRQELRPHLQPTGICLLALAGEADDDGRIRRSVAHLERELNEATTTASLCYGLLGLAAMGKTPAAAGDWLTAARQRTRNRGDSPYEQALLALAAAGQQAAVVQLPRSKR